MVQRRGGDDRIELRVLPRQKLGHPGGEVEGVLILTGKRIQPADAIGRVAGQVERDRLRAATDVQDAAAQVRLDELAEAFRHGVRGDAATVDGEPLVGLRVGVQGFAPEGERPRRQQFQAGQAFPQRRRPGKAAGRKAGAAEESVEALAEHASRRQHGVQRGRRQPRTLLHAVDALPQRLEFHLDFLAEIRQRAGELLHLGQNAARWWHANKEVCGEGATSTDPQRRTKASWQSCPW